MDTKAIAERVAGSVVLGYDHDKSMTQELRREFEKIELDMKNAVAELDKELKGKNTGLGKTSIAVQHIGKRYSEATKYFFA